jgi:hypothetical protein
VADWPRIERLLTDMDAAFVQLQAALAEHKSG